MVLDGVAYALCGGRIFSCGINPDGGLRWHERQPVSRAGGKIYTANTMKPFVLAYHRSSREAAASAGGDHLAGE